MLNCLGICSVTQSLPAHVNGRTEDQDKLYLDVFAIFALVPVECG